MLRINNWKLWRRMWCCFPLQITNYDHADSPFSKFLYAWYTPTANLEIAAGQIDSVLEMLDKLDPETVKKFVGYAQKAQKVLAPVMAFYGKCNKAVGGKLHKYLAVALLAVVAFYVSKWTGLLGYSPAADGAPVDLNALKDAAVDAAAAVTNAEDDEFA